MKISFITPVCNSQGHIEKCVLSVQKQRYPNIEFIAVDYGTPDGSRSIVLSTLANASYYELVGNYNLGKAIDYGIKQATGDVVCILAPDDQLPERDTVQKVVNAFREHKANVVYGKGMVHEGNDILRTLRIFGSKPHKDGKVAFGKVPLHTSIYVDRKFLLELGFGEGNYSMKSEYEMYLRLFMQPKINTHYLDDFIVRVCLDGDHSNKDAIQKNKPRKREMSSLPFRRIAVG